MHCFRLLFVSLVGVHARYPVQEGNDCLMVAKKVLIMLSNIIVIHRP